MGDVVKVTLDIDIQGDKLDYIVLDDPLPAGLVAINSAIKTEEFIDKGGKKDREEGDEDGWYWDYWDYATGSYRFVPNYFEIRDDTGYLHSKTIPGEGGTHILITQGRYAKGSLLSPPQRFKRCITPLSFPTQMSVN